LIADFIIFQPAIQYVASFHLAAAFTAITSRFAELDCMQIPAATVFGHWQAAEHIYSLSAPAALRHAATRHDTLSRYSRLYWLSYDIFSGMHSQYAESVEAPPASCATTP